VKNKIIPFPKESLCLRFLYNTIVGRCVLKILTQKALSDCIGKFLDSKYSRFLIPRFLEKNNINICDYEDVKYQNFNECFSRKIKRELRPIDYNRNHLIAPCDGKLSVYNITNNSVFPIKQSKYTIDELLDNKELANQFLDGICLVFRLTVDCYHRFSYIESGHKSKNFHINGKLHTVRPIALKKVPVFTENSREYTVIDTENFGKIVQMEVGAMLVGKICNFDEEKDVVRGEEKGTFLYGGSTVIVILQKDSVNLPNELFEATRANCEIMVKMGEQLGFVKKEAVVDAKE